MRGEDIAGGELDLTSEQQAILEGLDATERRQALWILEQVLRPPVADPKA